MKHDTDLDDLREVLDDMIHTGTITSRQAESAINATKAGIAYAKREFTEVSPEPALHEQRRVRGNKQKILDPA